MKLREHPLMSYRGISNWPPIWVRRSGGGKTLWGEVGVLRDVLFTPVQPRSRIYLLMEHEGEEYIGALLFSDPAWVPQIRDLLKQHLGSRVACIGELEISQFDWNKIGREIATTMCLQPCASNQEM